MAANAQFRDVNAQLRQDWLTLCEQEENGEAVTSKKTALANQVMVTNEKLVWSSIQPYIKRRPEIADDLFNVAAGQLWRAFTMWDPERSTLGTASKPYISGAVRREVAALDYPHLKYDDFTLRGKVVKARRSFTAKHNREPSAKELEELTGVSLQKQDMLFASPALSMEANVPGHDDMSLEGLVSDSVHDDSTETRPTVNVDLEPEVAQLSDPMDLLTHLVYTGSGVSSGAQAREAGAVLGLPSKDIPRTSDLLAGANARIKLRRYIDRDPTPEQLAVAANISEKVAADILNAAA